MGKALKKLAAAQLREKAKLLAGQTTSPRRLKKATLERKLRAATREIESLIRVRNVSVEIAGRVNFACLRLRHENERLTKLVEAYKDQETARAWQKIHQEAARHV